MRRTSFTPEQDQFLKENYMEMPAKRMARKIGKSEFGTFNRMRILGIQAPIEKRREWKQAGLKKGHGWNKGMKQEEYMSDESIASTKKTRFKKGNIPPNTSTDGDLSLRSDGYIWTRLSLGKWELLHRVIYSNHYQVTLNTEDNIIFKDGDDNGMTLDKARVIALVGDKIIESAKVEVDYLKVLSGMSENDKQVNSGFLPKAKDSE